MESLTPLDQSNAEAFKDHKVDNTNAVHDYFISKVDVLVDPTIRRDYYSRMEPVAFLEEVQRVRSLAETGDVAQLHPFDGEGVRTGSLKPPDQREKEELLKETWGTVRRILNNHDFSDDEALERSGLVTGIMLLSVHPFGDGNGRTSRLISYMIARGCKEAEEDIQHILSNDGSEYWRTSAYVEAAPLGRSDNGAHLGPYLQKYINTTELEESFQSENYAASSEEARKWQGSLRKRRAAYCCAFLDLVEANPELPLSADIKEVEKRFAERAIASRKQIQSDDYDEELKHLLISGHLSRQSQSIRMLLAAKSVLGESIFDKEKRFSVLDQIVAFSRYRSKIWWGKYNADDALKEAKDIYERAAEKA